MPNQYLTMSRHISTQFIAYLVGRLTVTDFAQWVYQTPDLSSVLSPTDYAELMTLDFNQTEAPSLINRLLRGYIDWAQYEKEQLAELLMAIIWKDDALTALVRAHEQFKHGLRFLNVLGNEYGRAVLATHGPEPRLPEGQEGILTVIYPRARDEAKRLLHCLVSGKIKFTGTYTQEGYPEYVEI